MEELGGRKDGAGERLSFGHEWTKEKLTHTLLKNDGVDVLTTYKEGGNDNEEEEGEDS